LLFFALKVEEGDFEAKRFFSGEEKVILLDFEIMQNKTYHRQGQKLCIKTEQLGHVLVVTIWHPSQGPSPNLTSSISGWISFDGGVTSRTRVEAWGGVLINN
jgi:hypothetical protein